MNAATITPSVTVAGPTGRLSFELPAHLEAGEPPEARGMTRDAVRMLVAERSSRRLTHTTFATLPSQLRVGDLVVINTSAVVPAAVAATSIDGTKLVVHLSTRLDDGHWVAATRGTCRRRSADRVA